MKTSIEQIGYFKTTLDPYNGITIEAKDLPNNKNEFKIHLEYLLNKIKNTRNLIWVYVPIDKSTFISILVDKGFIYHTCYEKELLLVKRIKPNTTIPTAANYTLGVGAVVINDKNELLVVREKVFDLGFKLPGGHIDDGELISKALVREVFEETGIKVEFKEIISLGNFYPHQFNKSSLYVVCTAKPLNYKINIKDTNEIQEAKWVNIDEYLNDKEVFEYSKTLLKTSLNFSGLTKDNKDILKNINKNFELFFPIQK